MRASTVEAWSEHALHVFGFPGCVIDTERIARDVTADVFDFLLARRTS
jgi:hypothetical protein